MDYRNIAVRIAKDVSLSDVSKSINEALAKVDSEVHEQLESEALEKAEEAQEEAKKADAAAHKKIMDSLEKTMKDIKNKL